MSKNLTIEQRIHNAIGSQKVEEYNNVFRTNYPPIGLKFGDYVFTADEYGNIDVRMKTNAVKPYLGIGFGQHFAKAHRLSLALDGDCVENGRQLACRKLNIYDRSDDLYDFTFCQW